MNGAVIDRSQDTCLPGLIDAHAHVLIKTDDYQVDHLRRSSGYKALRGLNVVQEMLRSGWTTVRILGDADVAYAHLDVRTAIREGLFIGPRLTGSPGMKALEKAVEAAILEVFREMDGLGGVLAAVEQRYQRSQIQEAAYRMERQIQDGTRPIIGLNRHASENGHESHGDLVRPSKEKQQSQIARLKQFKQAHAQESGPALDRLEQVVESGGNVFAELLNTVEVCSLGQITERLHEVSGHYRPTV